MSLGFDLIWDLVRGIFGRRPHDRADVQRVSGNVHHDHPLRSGACEQGIGRWGAVQHAAIEQAPEDVLALLAAI